MSAVAHSATGAGKRRRMARIFGADGRAVVVAMDHPAYMGAGVPSDAVDAVASARPGPDGVLATWHLARSRPEAFADTALVLRVDGGVSDLGDSRASDDSSLLYTAEQAMTLGADAVVIMIYPGAVDEHRSLQRLAVLAAECERLGLPVMAESIPGGWAQNVPWTDENVGRGARIAVELGADIVKTMCPHPGTFAAVTGACPGPVLALGGPRGDEDALDYEDALVSRVRRLVDAGGAGVVFGRNVWGSPDPAALIARLREAVHL